MRFTPLIILALSLLIAIVQNDKAESTDASKERIPTTLAEAHAELERILTTDELAKIDAMESENDMIEYHFIIGKGLRNSWGLWAGSPLSRHMQQLGFAHPDDMSGVILKTFWCKRHGKPFLLNERAVKYAAHWDAVQKREDDEKRRVELAKLKMRSMIMGLRLTTVGVSTIKMPDRIYGSLRARFLSRYRDGVFIAVLKRKGMGDDQFVNEPYFFSNEDGMIHKINIPGIQDFNSAVVAGQIAWFTGTSNGESVLLGITPDRRQKIALPKDGRPPQLGLHHEALLTVYPKGIYKLVNDRWQTVYEGDISLPRSGPPPQLKKDLLYLRDEGMDEDWKRLWWLNVKGEPELKSLDMDIGVVGSHGPRWENSFSYIVSDTGDLWACVGAADSRMSLLRKSKDGTYSIAIMNNSLRFTPELLGSEESDQGISVSAVSSLQDDTILLVGNSGLYFLKGTELFQKLVFTNTQQNIPIHAGKNVYHWCWDPSKVLVFKKDCYFISGAFGGIYILKKDKKGEWAFESLDEKLGEPVAW